MEAPAMGPAIVEEEYTTILVADGWSVAPGKTGDLIARRQSDQRGGDAE